MLETFIIYKKDTGFCISGGRVDREKDKGIDAPFIDDKGEHHLTTSYWIKRYLTHHNDEDSIFLPKFIDLKTIIKKKINNDKKLIAKLDKLQEDFKTKKLEAINNRKDIRVIDNEQAKVNNDLSDTKTILLKIKDRIPKLKKYKERLEIMHNRALKARSKPLIKHEQVKLDSLNKEINNLAEMGKSGNEIIESGNIFLINSNNEKQELSNKYKNISNDLNDIINQINDVTNKILINKTDNELKEDEKQKTLLIKQTKLKKLQDIANVNNRIKELEGEIGELES